MAAGKVGIQYASAWMVTQGMNTLVQNSSQFLATPERLIANVFSPPAEAGQIVRAQTNSPKGYRIFVSNRTAHPEAVLKMAVMIYHYTAIREDRNYYTSPDNWPIYKYIPWGDTMTPTEYDLYRGYAVRVAAETGDTSIIEANGWETSWINWQMAREGTGVPFQAMMNGPGSAYDLLYDYYRRGRILVDGFSGLPTETMALRADILRGNLETAMAEVIMGADISVWDQAIDRWYSNGGTQIVNEVNQWYDGLIR